MTCIAAFTDHVGMTAIGCDTGMSGAFRSELPTKIFRVGPMRVGLTGPTTFDRWAAECVAETPEQLADDWSAWARARGHGEVRDGIWSLGACALAVQPRKISEVYACGSVVEPSEGYSAAGSGAEVAIGVLWLARQQQLPAECAVRCAIEAAIAHANGCHGRVIVEVCS